MRIRSYIHKLCANLFDIKRSVVQITLGHITGECLGLIVAGRLKVVIVILCARLLGIGPSKANILTKTDLELFVQFILTRQLTLAGACWGVIRVRCS